MSANFCYINKELSNEASNSHAISVMKLLKLDKIYFKKVHEILCGNDGKAANEEAMNNDNLGLITSVNADMCECNLNVFIQDEKEKISCVANGAGKFIKSSKKTLLWTETIINFCITFNFLLVFDFFLSFDNNFGFCSFETPVFN